MAPERLQPSPDCARTRIGGDSWDVLDVPLGEDEELYEIDILNAGDVVRTLFSTTPSVTYTNADQISDFGSAQPSIDLCVYQMSTIYGRGSAARATL